MDLLALMFFMSPVWWHELRQWISGWVSNDRLVINFIFTLIFNTIGGIKRGDIQVLYLIVHCGIVSFFVELLTNLFCPIKLMPYMPFIVATLACISIVVNNDIVL